MLGQTPMMLQYQQIKQEYPDTILFFRLGDFYEMFGADAEVASRELEITLTGREAGLETRVPMCGVPYHAVDNYINRLIQKGFKVAICEQVEDPKTAKGIVRREVIRVVTPGTYLDSQGPQQYSENYLASLSCQGDIWGLAVCDAATGEFWVVELSGPEGYSILKDELIRLNPVEILLPQTLISPYQDLLAHLERTIITNSDPQKFTYKKALDTLLEHFQVRGPEALGIGQQKQAIASAGALICYLQETQKAPPRQIRTISRYKPEAYLSIDATTFRNLELTRTVRQNERKGSLLDILDKTKTALGARLLKSWLERPLTERKSLEERLDAVEELKEHWSERQALRKNLEEVYDLERLTTRILYRRAQPRELVALKKSLAVLPQVKNITKALAGSENSSEASEKASSEYLARLNRSLDTLEDIRSLLEKALVEEPPFNLKEGGVIKAGFHTELDSLREASSSGKMWIAGLESKERERTGIKSLKVGFNKVFGYYFEVTKANLSLVPEYFQRKQTLSNGERYVTEELIRLESQVLGSEEKLLALEEELYLQLMTEIGQEAKRVQQASQILAHFDVLQSLAEVAVQNGYTRPLLREKQEQVLVFEELRHPVVETVMADASFVPNDLKMTEAIDLFIITGPNMGGKSTFCRSVALAVIMAQVGSFVPARRAVISIRDRVFARVGASDDLRTGQSTFMVEMNEVANILKHATPNSLVILDEVGRGTSTYDGLGMAWAVTEYLVQTLKAKTLFATHYHELTRLEEMFPTIKNLSLAVQEKGEEIIFLHRIVEGPADKSYGIQVGRLAGLPPWVIKRAGEILEHLEAGAGEEENGWTEKKQQVQPAAVPRELLPDYSAIESLLQMDILNMTPLEAMNRLYEIQLLLRNSINKTAAK